MTTLEASIARTVACSEARPCDNPNHNHTGYRTPPPLVDQLANALTLALHEHVGRVEVKAVMQAALDAYADAECERQEHHSKPMQPSRGVYRREILYDRDTHDYACYLDGELVCFGRTYSEAETTLDELVLQLVSG